MCINVRLRCPLFGMNDSYCAFVLPFALPYTPVLSHIHDLMMLLVINMTMDEYGYFFLRWSVCVALHTCVVTHT